MAGEIALSDINGLTSRVYDKTVKNFLPQSAILQRRIGWDNGTRSVGESYQVTVVVKPPNGFTYAGSTGAVATLKNPRNMVIKQAAITPFEMELREQMAYAALSRTAQEGEGAVKTLVGTMFGAMKTSASNRLEIGMLHGQRSLGTVESVTDLGGNSGEIVITAATWAPGMWNAVNAGATLDSFTSTTKNNATGALIITGITTASRKLTCTYSGTLASECAAGDVLYFEGAWDGTTYNEMPGLIVQGVNTTGTSLGLSATTYPTWAGNSYDVAGNISSEVVEDACSQLRDRGATGKISGYFANRAYSVLINELKMLRMADSSYSSEKGKNGYKSISYFSPDIGEIEIVNHPFMKLGEMLLLNEEDCGRVGSSDLTFGIPSTDGKLSMFERVANTNAVECQLFTDQCVIQKVPAHCLVGTGITYT